MSDAVRVLVVDDDDSFRQVLSFHLSEEGYAVDAAGDGLEGLEAFDRGPAVVVTDLKMPGLDGLALLSEIKRRDPSAVVIVITAFGDTETAVQAMKAGAFDFLPKPCERERIKLTVARAVEHAGLRREVRRLRQGASGAKGLIWRSDAMRRVVETADQVADSDVSVLIEGESGTGKELLARRIHRLSGRRGDLVAVNCAGVPRDLLESELFGHVKGAFTGAVKDRRGRVRQAHRGTLFLDEIGDLPADLQPRLLRVLQERTVDVVGSDRPEAVDVRVVAATNQDLPASVKEGRFREDLYFRLAVLPLRIPPLRERPDDIVLLADHFLRQHAPDRGWTIPADAQAALERHAWPGNVRELDNVCRRVALLAKDGVFPADAVRPTPAAGPADRIELPPGGASLRGIERRAIEIALERHGWNQSAAARWLDVPRHILLYRMDKYGIPRTPPR